MKINQNLKLRIGVSSCLLGEKVRWDGNHKQDHYLTDYLGQCVDWVTVCPEVEAGMGIPRETASSLSSGKEGDYETVESSSSTPGR